MERFTHVLEIMSRGAPCALRKRIIAHGIKPLAGVGRKEFAREGMLAGPPGSAREGCY